MKRPGVQSFKLTSRYLFRNCDQRDVRHQNLDEAPSYTPAIVTITFSLRQSTGITTIRPKRDIRRLFNRALIVKSCRSHYKSRYDAQDNDGNFNCSNPAKSCLYFCAVRGHRGFGCDPGKRFIPSPSSYQTMRIPLHKAGIKPTCNLIPNT